MIDHDMAVIMGICERILVLDGGVAIASGTPAEVRADPLVIYAYLGSEGLEIESVRRLRQHVGRPRLSMTVDDGEAVR